MRRLVLRDYRLRRLPGLRIDTTFPAGINVLLGTNGVGKTTLLTSLVDRRLRVPGGAAQVEGAGEHQDVGLARVALLPQRPAVPEHLDVADLVAYGCDVRRAPQREGAELVERLGLGSLAGRRVRTLSGGERQRLCLVLAFVGYPDVVLLDEPTVALDPLARAQFAAALRTVARADTVVVLSTHQAPDIEVADRLHLLGPHGIGWHGRPDEFLEVGGGRFDDAFAVLSDRARPENR